MALKYTTASKVTLIIENPIITSFIAYFTISEAITVNEIFVFVMTTLGVYLIAQSKRVPGSKVPDSHALDPDWELVGLCLSFVGAMIGNIGIISMRRLKRTPVDPVIVTLYTLLFNCIVQPIFVLAYETYRGSYTKYDIDTMICLVIIGVTNVFAVSFTNKIFYTFKSSWAVVMLNLPVIFTFFFDVEIMGVDYTTEEIAGCVLLLLGSLLLVMFDVKSGKDKTDSGSDNGDYELE